MRSPVDGQSATSPVVDYPIGRGKGDDGWGMRVRKGREQRRVDRGIRGSSIEGELLESKKERLESACAVSVFFSQMKEEEKSFNSLC
jgi:hypothetical protein